MATLTIPVIFVDDGDQPLTPQLFIPLIPDTLDISGICFHVTEIKYLVNDGYYRVVVKDAADERTASTSSQASESRVARGQRSRR